MIVMPVSGDRFFDINNHYAFKPGMLKQGSHHHQVSTVRLKLWKFLVVGDFIS